LAADVQDTTLYFMTTLSALESERSTWDSQWKELSRYFAPRHGRFIESDRNQGHKVHNDIIDESGAVAARTLSAGLMGGTTSPARPWFKLGLSDLDLMDYHPVKMWLSGLTRLMLAILSKSNAYSTFRHNYTELGVFGTCATLVMPNYENVVHFHPLTTGEYSIAEDAFGNVTTLYRKFDMSINNIVREYGYENCSQSIRNLYDTGKGGNQWRTIVHAIEPRRERDHNKLDAANMPFVSAHFEYGGNENKFLRMSGFPSFPGYVARWDRSGGDIYGNSPAMLALGSNKQLQFAHKRKMQIRDQQAKPAVFAPGSMKNIGLDLLPGGVNYIDMQKGERVEPVFNVNFDANGVLEDIADLRGRINETMYKDLFLMLANIDHTGMTAREVAERHEEKLLMLGPVSENLQNEKDRQVIRVLYAQIEAAGIMPPPPPELEGQDFEIEFVSVLAQAQRAVGTSGLNRLIETVGGIAGMKPDVIDKIDFDQIVDLSADALGVDPSVIVPDEVVAQIRQQRADAQAAAEGAAVAAETAKAAASAAQAGTSLDDMISQFSGYGLPQGEA